MLDAARHVNQFLLQYGRGLVGEIGDERLAEQPLPGVNHPAWILGHLALTADGAVGVLGDPKSLPVEWAALFGSGSKPSAARSTYPTKDELLRAVEQSYDQLRQKAAGATQEQLSQPPPDPRAKERFPTVKELLAFILTGHVGVHLGQLSAWRRMIGLPPMF
jgi:hypothetical protein